MIATLVYFKENGERKDFPLKPGKTVVGRKENCGYRIPLSSVSREHCVFELDDDGLRVQDLGSSNGTYVNNKRIAEVKLKPGDHVVVGPVVFTVQIDGYPTDPKPVKVRLEDRGKKPSAEEVVDDVLGGDDEDETRRHGHVDDEDSDLAETDVKRPDDADPLQALEALAGSDDDINPFADLDDEDDDTKKKKK